MHTCTGDELQRRLATQLAMMGRACDHVYLSAARFDADPNDNQLKTLTLQVQRMVLESGRWHAVGGFAHAIGGAALMQAQRAQTDQERALTMIKWLWNGKKGVAHLGTDKAFLGLRGLLSYGSDMKAAVSPFAAATTAVAQLAMSLITGELTLGEWLEKITAQVSNACSEVLSGVEDQLRRVLNLPHEMAVQLVADMPEIVPPAEALDSKALDKVISWRGFARIYTHTYICKLYICTHPCICHL